MRTYIVRLFFIFLPTLLYAEQLSIETAREKAMEWFSFDGLKSKSYISQQIQPKQLSNDITCSFLFNYKDNYVIIGGTEEEPVIIGYGNQTNNEIPANALALIKDIDKVQQFYIKTSPTINGLKAFNPIPTEEILPFVPTVRSQEEPFNNSCPIYKHSNGTSEKTIVGCVATALEQVVTYYKYPSQLQDTLFGWETSHYNVDTIPQGTIIDFDNILNEYNDGEYSEKQAKAVSDLCYYCGIASHMNWAPSSSGANFSNAIEPLKKAFGYQNVKHYYSSEFNVENWHKVLYEELKNKRPIIFAGYTTAMAGHAFVVDGINKDGLYHILWGYGGEYDGYFNLNILNTYENPKEKTSNGELFGCYCNQEVLFLHPEAQDYSKFDTLVSKNRLKVDSVLFMRQPDLNRYVTAKLYVRNTSSEALTSSYLLLTYDPTKGYQDDSAEEVALAGCTLEPNESKCITAYCTFTNSGRRVLTVFTDDSLFAFTDTIDVAYSKAPQVKVNVTEPQPSNEQVIIKTVFQNTSSLYWSGNHIFYCLYEGDYNPLSLGSQHYTVLNLPPNGTFVDSVTFKYLKPSTKYTIIVRNTWSDVYEVQFTTKETSGINNPLSHTNNRKKSYYTINGMLLNKEPENGIYIIRDYNKTIKVIK